MSARVLLNYFGRLGRCQADALLQERGLLQKRQEPCCDVCERLGLCSRSPLSFWALTGSTGQKAAKESTGLRGRN
jgi:hypothetical protein